MRDTVRSTFKTMPVLESARLILRAMKRDDAEDMFEYSHRDDVTKYLLWEPHPDVNYTRRYLSFATSKYKSGGFYDWAIIWKENQKMIGTCGFTTIDTKNQSCQIGYVVNPNYQGRGIATEAVRRVTDFAFNTLGLIRVSAEYMSENSTSRRVMEKAGMKYEGTHRSCLWVKGRFESVGVCAALRSEWK